MTIIYDAWKQNNIRICTHCITNVLLQSRRRTRKVILLAQLPST